MDEKISLEAIALYGDNFSEKVVRDFFSRKDRITGGEILSFCNVQQVNLFIVKELFKAWKDEQKKIKSPFFDFDNAEVKEAMENLMNLLSKNISIDRAHFLPLVKRAVNQSLMAIFDPYDFYSMLITGENNKLDVVPFREEIKYLKINKAPLERMLQKLEEKNVTEMPGNEAFGILDQILEEVNFTPEDVDGYIEMFSQVTPLDPSSFFIAKLSSTPEPPPVEEKAQNETVFFAAPEKSYEPQENNYSAKKPVSNPVPTLHEKLTKEPRPTLAENFQRIRRIKESLTINQKFMFTKVLFHGDFELFSRAVDRLDQFDNFPSAMRYLEDEHASTWDRESEEFHEFMDLVEKRFA